MRKLLITALLAVLSGPALGESPYSGYEGRAIKSLSAEDIAILERGGGWGLALPAELNGVPGPAHLLDLRDELGLRPEQVAALEAIRAEMTAEAQAAGARFIAAEAALDAAFAEGRPDEAALRGLVRAAETARAELRFVHLRRHLDTPALLDAAQIARYAELRGYQGGHSTRRHAGH